MPMIMIQCPTFKRAVPTGYHCLVLSMLRCGDGYPSGHAFSRLVNLVRPDKLIKQ
jgi:hypothetical protein